MPATYQPFNGTPKVQPVEAPSDEDRAFWLQMRRAFVLMLTAIDNRYGFRPRDRVIRPVAENHQPFSREE